MAVESAVIDEVEHVNMDVDRDEVMTSVSADQVVVDKAHINAIIELVSNIDTSLSDLYEVSGEATQGVWCTHMCHPKVVLTTFVCMC
jgi:hypothetical protein